MDFVKPRTRINFNYGIARSTLTRQHFFPVRHERRPVSGNSLPNHLDLTVAMNQPVPYADDLRPGYFRSGSGDLG